MKIYTKTGDKGETGLFGGQRVSKAHVRVDAYGEVDELNSIIGLAVARLGADGVDDIAARLTAVQSELFTIGANLATPAPEDGGRPNSYIPPLDPERIGEMERWIDEAETELEPLTNFILPGGAEAAARLHLARTVCRRAERRVIRLADDAHIDDGVIVYLNRLSDYLFTLARLVNRRAGVADVPWQGGARKEREPESVGAGKDGGDRA
jgi:cob(I)alamin adenosyltransferase